MGEKKASVQTEGKFLSEEIGERLYSALREKIMRNRIAARKCESEETGSDSDCHSTTSTLEEVTRTLKEKINLLAFMKRVKRGMLSHQSYLIEQEASQRSAEDTTEANNAVVIELSRPLKRRRRAKARALTARKGARRFGQSIRRRPTFSPGYSIANRLRRRLLPNKGYDLRF